MPSTDDVLDKIQDDLDWRGPTGRAMGHCVLTREEATVVRDSIVSLRNENARLREATSIAVDLKADQVAQIMREAWSGQTGSR